MLEYLDFYRQDKSEDNLKYPVFDSKFTNYQNLVKLDKDGIMFLTVKIRGKNIIKEINDLPVSSWQFPNYWYLFAVKIYGKLFSSVSPVLIRIIFSTGIINILPSPNFPICPLSIITSTTSCFICS